ncbi:hypothetical protein STEG23_018692 [Scotinomys teguina]
MLVVGSNTPLLSTEQCSRSVKLRKCKEKIEDGNFRYKDGILNMHTVVNDGLDRYSGLKCGLDSNNQTYLDCNHCHKIKFSADRLSPEKLEMQA